MQPYYECHITIESDNPSAIEKDILECQWKFSKIDGDPVLGMGIKCYATKNFPIKFQEANVITMLESVAEYFITLKHKVVRSKIEKVIYDNHYRYPNETTAHT